MAKVTGPLLSFDASGSVGGTAVYSKWKGRNYTRLRVIPRNPKSNGQAEVRTKLASLGKNNKKVVADSVLYTQVLAVTPTDQSWMSYLASQMAGSNFATFDASKNDYEDGGNVVVAGYFDTEADAIGLASFELPYGAYGEVTGGCQMWACAVACFLLGLAIAPVSPEDMSEAQVTAFGAAYLA